MDYDLLKQAGLQHIERLGSQLWTDYNPHDPGVTILEQACYALTDLLYRMDYAIPDLLAEGGHDPFASLFGPAQILTTHPVTLLDLRKQIVDIPGVRNAWIEPAAIGPAIFFHQEENTLSLAQEDQPDAITLRGLYQIWLETERGHPGNLSTQVAERLHARRSLCEDFAIARLDEQAIRINASIEADPASDLRQLQQAIYEQIDAYFSPPVRFTPWQELLDGGVAADAIFDGPALQHGFIDSATLQASGRRTELRASDLIHILMDIPGVLAVQRFAFASGEKWLLKLERSASPRLDREGSAITLVKGGVAILLPPPAPTDSAPARPPATEIPLPSGQDRHIGDDYYAIQHQFPDIYGVNSNGLPASASPLRRAQMKQLKAYLLLFDQALANQFAQLANVRRLFSFAAEDADAPTYFLQLLDDARLGLDEGSPTFLDIWTAPDKSARLSRLHSLIAALDDGYERKNRFLDHLLARFAESLSDYATLTQDSPAQQIRRKQTFLQRYAELGQSRHTAPNYQLPAAGASAGLEQRLRLKLGIDPDVELYLVEHILLRPIPGDQNQRSPILRDLRRSDPYSLQVSLILPASLQHLRPLICEETPVHLTVHFPQFNPTELAQFASAHQAWRQALGDPLTPQQTVRATRDRLLDLLGIGRTYPLSDLAVMGEMAAPGEKAHIRIALSQTDVRYQLCDEDGTSLAGLSVVGNGGEAQLETPPINADVTFRILACKLLGGDDCASNPYRIFLQQSAAIRVGVDSHLEAEIVRSTDAQGGDPAPAALLEPDAAASPTAARIIPFGRRVQVEVRQAQEGVRYQLFPAQDANQPALSAAVTGEGGGRSITLLSNSLEADADLHIRAAKILPDGDGELTDWLAAVLPLKVYANTDLPVAIPAPILVPGGQPVVRIAASQPGVRYRAFLHVLTDQELVFGAGDGDVLTTPVAGFPAVQVRNPAWQAVWQQTPPDYAAASDSLQGDGSPLALTLDAVQDDSLIILQAEKQHQAGDRPVPSAVQLRQAVTVLTLPDPAPPLSLRMTAADGGIHAIQVSNGQRGVFYHFRLTADGEDISLPAYFHQWATDNLAGDKGVGRLRIEGDFVVTAVFSPQTPLLELAAPLPPDATLHIRARKARTNATIELQPAALPALPIIQAPQSIAVGEAAAIRVQGQNGVRYQLWRQGLLLPPELTGTDAMLEFPTGPLAEDSLFTLRAIHPLANGMTIEFDQAVLIKTQDA
ncbi:hypothetical protein VSS37_20755 [Candidatus Thiothrix sp. Deng01]|uniref:Baseplate protein J-like domain-containing protein n=1 Tax=Candidatus Thiothrix phosphatis TaxID=3112415 RepID=A0ABU6D331_9GAMM|nr:hypothetical protein [Candidatus Thiothrix sp. Deng01]MEB4593420.1 hypothetical protein [Candidatus Thiothrix sp. Deng01]